MLLKIVDDKMMSEENMASVPIPSITTPQEIKLDVPVPKRSNTKKIAFLTVGGVLVVAMVLATCLVGVYLHKQSTKDILEYKLKFKVDGNQAEEYVSRDLKDNVEIIRVEENGQETWIVNDFNRNLQLFKMSIDGTFKCYVTPLNRTVYSLPQDRQIPQVNGLDTAGQNYSRDETAYSMSSSPITDTSILSNKGRELCAGLHVYWAQPSCNNGLHDGRHKRWSCGVHCWVSCCFSVHCAFFCG